MIGIDKLMCRAAAVILLAAVATTPAKAQFLGGGGEDMMTQMAPMLEMMKARMGKRRFAMLMQTVGPMMSNMMEGGGGMGAGSFGDGVGGGPGGGLGGLGGLVGGGFGGGFGGYGMGGFNGSEMVAMIPQIMTMVNMGGGGRPHRRGRRHIR